MFMREGDMVENVLKVGDIVRIKERTRRFIIRRQELNARSFLNVLTVSCTRQYMPERLMIINRRSTTKATSNLWKGEDFNAAETEIIP